MTDEASGRDRIEQPEVVVVAAMPSEIRHVLDVLGNRQRHQTGRWQCWSGRVDGQSVTALLSGIGMVNAAAALSALLATRLPVAIINVGCAGAHRPDVLHGDVVVATETVAHGSVTILPDGTERFADHRYDIDGVTVIPHTLPADPRLLGWTRVATDEWRPDAWPGLDRQPQVHFGVVASADAWTQQTARIQMLHARHRSLCEDMEAAALAQVAAIYGVPFLALKDVSNNEYLRATEHGPVWPTLDDVSSEVGRRAWDLARRMLPMVDAAVA